MKKKIVAMVLSLAMMLPGNVAAFAGQAVDIVQPVTVEEAINSAQQNAQMKLETDVQENGTERNVEQESLTAYDFYWDGSGKNITPDEEGAVKSENLRDDDPKCARISQQSVNMNVSQNGIELIKQFEGCRLTAYKALSSEQYYTIGYGHYGPDVHAGMTITQEQAESMLRSDLVKYVGYVNTFLNKYGISINQNQFDALTSFTYNLGNVWVSYSTFQLKTYLINGVSNYTDEQITTAFTNWNKSGGAVIDGLTRRRKAEAQLFLKGISSVCTCSDSYAGNYTCTSNSTLNIRSGHGSGYSVIGSIPSGATVYVSKADGSWAHVSYNGVNGYASMQYLSKIPDTHNPEGHMESISGGIGTISLSGWVFDRDVPDQAVEVHVYVGGPAGSADVKWIKTGIIADAYRPDVDNVYGQGKYHGIAGTLDVPLSGECDVYIYAINAGGGNHNPCIGSGKVTIQEKDLTGPEITDYKISDIGIEGYTVRCKVTDKSGVDRVQFPTWTANNDQDDLADDWAVNAAYTGTKNGDVYTYRVKTSMHNNEKGSYVTHIYAYDKYGNVNVKALDSVVVPDLPDSTMELGNDFYAKIQNYVTKTMLAKVNTGKEWDAYFRDEDDSRDQIWHFVRNGSEESYTISCEGNEPLVLSVEKEEDSDYNNVKVDLRSESSGQKWKILKKDGRYYLQPLCSETRVLDVKNATADTVSAEINSYNEYGGCGFEIIKTEKQTELLQSKNLVAEGNYGGHSYQVFDQKMSWTDAKRACEALGGHLVTIKDEGEQTFIETLLKSGNASMDLYWLGLYYRYQTGFSWVTDEDVDYENWASSYPLAGLAANPMGYCAHMYGANQTDSAFEWRNVNNAYAANMGVICEFETVKTSVDDVSGVVIGGRAADALRINWKKDSKASGYILEQYKNGSWTRIARIGSNATTTYRVEKLVPSTTYQFRIHAFAFDGKTPVYGNHTYMNGKTNPAIISGAKISGRAADALRLNWNKDSKASGYIVEQYKNGSWTRIARIGSNATTTYRVEKLSPSTTYKFRVQSFGFDGKTALYGNYAYVNGKTNPAIMSGLKIGGTAKDALRLNWNKDSKASGYIIEQYKNGKWTRIARIGSNATTTYRVEKLQSKTTYKFRVKSFGFDGSTAIYGAYGYINGTTY